MRPAFASNARCTSRLQAQGSYGHFFRTSAILPLFPSGTPLTVAGTGRAQFREIIANAFGVDAEVAAPIARRGAQVVASDKSAGWIEASQRSRWMGFTDDIVVRVGPTNSGSRIDGPAHLLG